MVPIVHFPRTDDAFCNYWNDIEYIEGMTLTHHTNQMRLSTFVAIAAVIGGSFLWTSPAKAYSKCTYLNKATNIKSPISCRVITSGVSGDVIFIDEYRSNGIVRHDKSSGWYAPKYRNDECLLRKQGLESICNQRSWDGI